MKKGSRKRQRAEAESYTRDVQQRLLQLLTRIAIDAPLPLLVIEQIIQADSMIGGPTHSVLLNIEVSSLFVDQERKELLSQQQVGGDTRRQTLSVSAQQQQRIMQRLAHTVPTHQAQTRVQLGLDDPDIALMFTIHELIERRELSRDGCALLVPHLVLLVERLLMHQEGEEGCSVVQGLEGLWMLYGMEVLPGGVARELTDRAVQYCQQHAPTWDEFSAVRFLYGCAEEIVEHDLEGSAQAAAAFLDLAAPIVKRLPKAEREPWKGWIKALRQRMSAATESTS